MEPLQEILDNFITDFECRWQDMMAEKLGLADKGLKDKPYDKSKKYQGYKRFIRGRTQRKADGGIVDVV